MKATWTSVAICFFLKPSEASFGFEPFLRDQLLSSELSLSFVSRQAQPWILGINFWPKDGQLSFGCGWDLAVCGWDLAECGWDLAECGWELAECGWDLAELWMRSSRMDRASDRQCQSRNSPGFIPSIHRHNGFWGAADEPVLKNVHKKKKKKIPLRFKLPQGQNLAVNRACCRCKEIYFLAGF